MIARFSPVAHGCSTALIVAELLLRVHQDTGADFGSISADVQKEPRYHVELAVSDEDDLVGTLPDGPPRRPVWRPVMVLDKTLVEARVTVNGMRGQYSAEIPTDGSGYAEWDGPHWHGFNP